MSWLRMAEGVGCTAARARATPGVNFVCVSALTDCLHKLASLARQHKDDWRFFAFNTGELQFSLQGRSEHFLTLCKNYTAALQELFVAMQVRYGFVEVTKGHIPAIGHLHMRSRLRSRAA